MSLIFETLKKLKTQPGTGQVYSRPSPDERRTDILRRIIYSPLVTAGMAVLIVTAGFGMIYGLSVMNEQEPGHAAREVLPASSHAADPFSPNRSKGPLPSRDSIRFLPSSASTATATASVASRPAGPIAGPRSPAQVSSRMLAAVASGLPRQELPAGNNPSSKEHLEPPSIKAAGEADLDKVSGAQPERLLHDRMNEQAEITRLVAKIQAVMARGDDSQTERLLDELARKKGQDHAYVLKLKAYWHLRKEEYEPASEFLSIVLARNGGDLEAGINMAVVEIRTGRQQAAFKRLTRLRQQYPENVLIPELLQKLSK